MLSQSDKAYRHVILNYGCR